MLRRKITAASLILFAVLTAGCGIPPPVTQPHTPPKGLAERFKEVDRLLEGYRERGTFPGGVLAVGYQGSLVHLHPFGRLTYDADAPPVTAGTLYDLASLTKVIATTTLAMILVDEGKLGLDRPVRDFLPGFQGPGKEAVTVRHLLTHSSGLPAVAPLYKEIQGRPAYLQRIQAMDLEYAPGSRSVYSDLGILLLGEILERTAGQPLETFVRERVLDPLKMRDTMFRPPAALRSRIAPTEFDPWRGRLVQGEVHDENAFALGGVAPHAGLFGTAPDLARFAQMLLEDRSIVSRKTIDLFTRRAGIPGSDRALGWDTKSAEGSSAGTLFSHRSFGHTGFTGTSIWMDPERDLFVILLTNRVHPTRENNLIREVRPAVADAVVRALVKPVRVGLERIETAKLEGKRLGLIVHAASVTADGRHAVDVFRDRRLNVIRLFSPEHGLRGQYAAGEDIESGRDEITGLPVVSLYGDHRKPRPEDLKDLDALVFDLQDAGARFYTYVSTLILALESAAEAGIDFVVLDRPNPLGGERIEGPVSDARDLVPASFLNLAPGPLVHGLTMGEMATYVNARLAKPARLTVIPMEGWKRSMTWADTLRPWVPPSPNLRTAEAALAYPGTALLEATNVSEGRGTDSPFLLFGAPWLDLSESITVPGFHLESARFTPRTSKYPDQECRGFSVRVADPMTAEPYRLGITLLSILSRQPGFEWRNDRDHGDALSRLVGTRRPIEDLRAGKTVEEILSADVKDHETWRRERQAALLY